MGCSGCPTTTCLLHPSFFCAIALSSGLLSVWGSANDTPRSYPPQASRTSSNFYPPTSPQFTRRFSQAEAKFLEPVADPFIRNRRARRKLRLRRPFGAVQTPERNTIEFHIQLNTRSGTGSPDGECSHNPLGRRTSQVQVYLCLLPRKRFGLPPELALWTSSLV
ncbi:hypothetical protein C8R46DRAFT_420850 [Mycena filopes]|nr:hypothetical protein C8R46DRAFT_420850 [Mycena filopes]